MSVAEELLRFGGVATRQQLLEVVSRREFDAAVASAEIVRLARGRYALPQADEARKAAHAVAGVLCLESAALIHGWPVRMPPERPQVCLPRNRKTDRARLAAIDLHRLRLGPDDVVDGSTSRDRTILDCLRMLPFDDALAVGDSALRCGFPPARLAALVRDARGPASARTRTLAGLLTPDAANPFESALRAIALRVPGLSVTPQVSVRRSSRSALGGGVFLGRPDLVDVDLRMIIEAESFEWHGDRAALRSDAIRFNAFAVDGWLVLRFCWEDVMFRPEEVQRVIETAVVERTERLCPTCRAAA